MGFINGGDSPAPFSERKYQAQDGPEPWSHEDLVEAGNMECACVPLETIAAEFGRPVADVEAALGLSSRPRPIERAEFANVGFSNLKRR